MDSQSPKLYFICLNIDVVPKVLRYTAIVDDSLEVTRMYLVLEHLLFHCYPTVFAISLELNTSERKFLVVMVTGYENLDPRIIRV